MKKRILIISIFLVCLIIPLSLVIAENQTVDIEPLTISTRFKLEVFREGQLSGKKLLVSLLIFNDKDGFCVLWDHVLIEPLHYRKKVYLQTGHYSTEDSVGLIKNMRADKNGFSFRLERAGGLGLTADVVGKKIAGQDLYSVKANAIDFPFYHAANSETEKAVEIWKSTDKIVLPYKEVY